MCATLKGIYLLFQIFPRNDHLRITMYANALLGIWPYVFQNNPNMRKLYNIYSKLMFYYFLLYLLSVVIQLFILLTEDELRVEEIVANLSITLLYPITARRVWVMRSVKMKNLIKKILVTEDAILRSKDEEVIKIYKFHARQSQITNLLFISGIVIRKLYRFVVFYSPGFQLVNLTDQSVLIM